MKNERLFTEMDNNINLAKQSLNITEDMFITY